MSRNLRPPRRVQRLRVRAARGDEDRARAQAPGERSAQTPDRSARPVSRVPLLPRRRGGRGVGAESLNRSRKREDGVGGR